MKCFAEEITNKGRFMGIDFKGEAMTFKATSGAVLSGLAYCLEAMNQREETWKKRLEREHLRYLKLEQTCHTLRHKASLATGPDQEVCNLVWVNRYIIIIL
jgi:collagen type IV alpha-3-binding protein